MSTYALDMIEQSRSKTIRRHADGELDLWIERAAAHFGDDFWLMLHGIDAYVERRRRRAAASSRLRLIDEFAGGNQ